MVENFEKPKKKEVSLDKKIELKLKRDQKKMEQAMLHASHITRKETRKKTSYEVPRLPDNLMSVMESELSTEARHQNNESISPDYNDETLALIKRFGTNNIKVIENELADPNKYNQVPEKYDPQFDDQHLNKSRENISVKQNETARNFVRFYEKNDSEYAKAIEEKRASNTWWASIRNKFQSLKKQVVDREKINSFVDEQHRLAVDREIDDNIEAQEIEQSAREYQENLKKDRETYDREQAELWKNHLPEQEKILEPPLPEDIAA